MQKHNETTKCGECKGDPRQHNVRDAEIRVANDAGTVKVHPQHRFVFTGR